MFRLQDTEGNRSYISNDLNIIYLNPSAHWKYSVVLEDINHEKISLYTYQHNLKFQISDLLEPVNPFDAATKQYVDDKKQECVDKAGDTMTGPLKLFGPPTEKNHAATKGYVDEKTSQFVPKTGGTFTGKINASGGITNLPEPIDNSDAVNKSFLKKVISSIYLVTFNFSFAEQLSPGKSTRVRTFDTNGIASKNTLVPGEYLFIPLSARYVSFSYSTVSNFNQVINITAQGTNNRYISNISSITQPTATNISDIILSSSTTYTGDALLIPLNF